MRTYKIQFKSEYLLEGEHLKRFASSFVNSNGLFDCENFVAIDGKLRTAYRILSDVLASSSSYYDGVEALSLHYTSFTECAFLLHNYTLFFATRRITADTTGNTLYIYAVINGALTLLTSVTSSADHVSMARIGNKVIVAHRYALTEISIADTTPAIKTYDEWNISAIGNYKEFFCFGIVDLFKLDSLYHADFKDWSKTVPITLNAPSTVNNGNYVIGIALPTVPIMHCLDKLYSGTIPSEDPLIQYGSESLFDYVRTNQVILISLGTFFPYYITQWNDYLVVLTAGGPMFFKHVPELGTFSLVKFIEFKTTFYSGYGMSSDEMLISHGLRYLFIDKNLDSEVIVYKNDGITGNLFEKICSKTVSMYITWLEEVKLWQVCVDGYSFFFTKNRKLFAGRRYIYSQIFQGSVNNKPLIFYASGTDLTSVARIITMPFNMNNDGFKQIHQVKVNGRPGASKYFTVRLRALTKSVYDEGDFTDAYIERKTNPEGIAHFSASGKVFAIEIRSSDVNDIDMFIESIDVVYSQNDKRVERGYDVNKLN